MKLLRSIVADVVCKILIDARKDTVHDLEASEDRNKGRGKLLKRNDNFIDDFVDVAHMDI